MEDLEDGIAMGNGEVSIGKEKGTTRRSKTNASINAVSIGLPLCMLKLIPLRKRIVVTATPMSVAEMVSGTAP